MREASVSLTSGVGGRSYGVQGIMTVKISLTSHELKKSKRMRLRVLVCDDVKVDIIIGLPSITAFNLLPVLTQRKYKTVIFYVTVSVNIIRKFNYVNLA